MFFINTDTKLLKNGGRKFTDMSLEEFEQKLYDAAKKYYWFNEDKSFDEWIKDPWVTIDDLYQVEKDLEKVRFDLENLTYSNEMPFTKNKEGNLCGFHTLDNGFSFLGGMAGGDWENPLFFIIYHDGKKFRGYIPAYGNTYNTDMNAAFGSEGDSDKYDDVIKKYTKFYIAQGIIKNNEEDFYLTECYCRYHGYDFEKINEMEVDWTRIEEDIKSRIVRPDAETTITLGLIKGRHPLPVKDYILEHECSDFSKSKLEPEIIERLISLGFKNCLKCEKCIATVNLYITGLTIVSLITVNLLNSWGYDVNVYGYDPINNKYYNQGLFTHYYK